MGRTLITSTGVTDLQRGDMDTTTTGHAVITKVIAGANTSLSSTGVDAGTGDVTINSNVYTVVNQSSSTYNVTSTNLILIILCDTTSNAITINLPTAVTNTSMIIVKKINSGSNSVTIAGFGGTETIDGSTTYVFNTQKFSITFISDNTNWQII